MRIDDLDRPRDKGNLRVVMERAVTISDWSISVPFTRNGFTNWDSEAPLSISLSNKNWPELVCLGVVQATTDRHIMDISEQRPFNPNVSAKQGQDAVYSVISAIAQHELATRKIIVKTGQLNQGEYKRRKMHLYDALIRDLKSRNKLSTIRDAWQVLISSPGEITSSNTMIAENLRGLMLFASDPDRFLVGFEGKQSIWKKVKMHSVDPRIGVSPYHGSTPYIEAMSFINEQDLAKILPTKVLPPGYEGLPVLKNNPLVAESLVETWYDRKFILPPNGTIVALRDSHISQMTIVERYGHIIALSRALNGDEFTTFINSDDASGYSSEMMTSVLAREIMSDKVVESSYAAQIVAQTYRALVCGIGGRRLHVSSAREEPIPSSDRRPPRPHITRGHKRVLENGHISLDQLENIAELVAKGIKVPALRDGETIVLPHFRPTGALNDLNSSPRVVVDYHQSKAFDPNEFIKGNGTLTQADIDRLRQEALGRKSRFA